jgi:hypothetical protein
MGARRRGTAIVVVVALTLPLALPAAASTTRNGATATTAADKVEPPEVVVRPEVVVEPEVEVRERRVVDRPEPERDRPTVRGRCEVDPHPDRCGPVNIRQLIWRLIKAGEWRLLIHLLIRLGII